MHKPRPGARCQSNATLTGGGGGLYCKKHAKKSWATVLIETYKKAADIQKATGRRVTVKPGKKGEIMLTFGKSGSAPTKRQLEREQKKLFHTMLEQRVAWPHQVKTRKRKRKALKRQTRRKRTRRKR